MAEPEPALHRFRAGDVELAWFEWHPEARGRGPTILLAHATGFHARAYDPVVARLGERHVVSVDQRGHGRSEKVPITDWRENGEELAALVRELDLEGGIGVGHSWGGHVLVEAARACPGAFARLLLIDPVIMSPERYRLGGWNPDLHGEIHPVAKRKNRFASPQEMIDRFRDRMPYSLFLPEALRAYCEHGLLPAPDGDGWVLACPPEIEASVYMTASTNPGIHESARALDIPVTILRAREASGDGGAMDFASSPTWPGLVHEFRHGREVYLADHTHFVPMEDPDLVARHVRGEGGTGPT